MSNFLPSSKHGFWGERIQVPAKNGAQALMTPPHGAPKSLVS